MGRVSRKVMEISGKQDSAATKDAVAMTVGLVVFWPALFFLIGEDKKEELSRLKGYGTTIWLDSVISIC